MMRRRIGKSRYEQRLQFSRVIHFWTLPTLRKMQHRDMHLQTP